jgi:hypothetical protein
VKLKVENRERSIDKAYGTWRMAKNDFSPESKEQRA